MVTRRTGVYDHEFSKLINIDGMICHDMYSSLNRTAKLKSPFVCPPAVGWC